jgi:hypothetical protein
MIHEYLNVDIFLERFYLHLQGRKSAEKETSM